MWIIFLFFYFKNNIICHSFNKRYCLILSSPSKLKHNFPDVVSMKKVASLLYPSLSCKVSCLALTFDSCFSLKKNWHGFNFIRRNPTFRLITERWKNEERKMSERRITEMYFLKLKWILLHQGLISITISDSKIL